MASEITTPESHQNYDMEIPEMTKERVRDADPNGGCRPSVHFLLFCEEPLQERVSSNLWRNIRDCRSDVL